MNDHRGPVRGRGAAENPPNRFDRLVYEDDPETVENAGPRPRTEFLRDASRTIIATNDSPDVGFAASVNPYRGCEHGCVYCVGPDTPVLYADMTWRPIGAVRVGDVLLGFDEFPDPGATRKFRKSVVQAVWASRQPTLRLRTSRTDVVTTASHRWLQARDFRWSCTHQLSPGRRLRYVPVARDEIFDDDYRLAYIAGLSLGDGTFRYEPGWRSSRLGFPAAYWRVALADEEPLARLTEYLRGFGVAAQIRPFDGGPTGHRPMKKVEVRSIPRLAIIHTLLAAERASRSYLRGFLAGFFDAEGHNGDSLRISQVDVGVLERVRRYARLLGFEFQLEPRPGLASTLRLVGRLIDRIRFFSVCRPAIQRKIDGILEREMNLDPEPIEAVEPGPVADVVDIQMSTGTFYAAGLATHNCYARPTHETLGFSAGLDFETKILVKEDAPELLRRALAAKSWTPQPIALSGVTDPYQPVERRLQLTRRCLEVLAECRNPVVVVTKNHLVTRDTDLLAALAAYGAAAVFLSVTTLDEALQRKLEPRTSPPARRLAAIEALRSAGVPVGVLVAPVIPAVNDHEIPAILAAAAGAGARYSGYVMLRLPHAVKHLFERWLEDHLPDRKDKVLNRIREIRDGRLNDPAFGSRMRGSGPYAAQVEALFALGCRRAGIGSERPQLSTAAFRRPSGGQLELLR